MEIKKKQQASFPLKIVKEVVFSKNAKKDKDAHHPQPKADNDQPTTPAGGDGDHKEKIEVPKVKAQKKKMILLRP